MKISEKLRNLLTKYKDLLQDGRILEIYAASKRDSGYRVLGEFTDLLLSSGVDIWEYFREIIPGGAFYNSTIESIIIPNSVTYISPYAFADCRSLTSITIPNSVTSIGNEAFSGCSSLTSVNIPDNLTCIGSYAFYYCSSLTNISVNENNQTYKSIDGNLYTKDGTVLIQYAIGKKTTSFDIPDSVTNIGSSAFEDCSSLTSVTIPNSVIGIGSSMFYDCKKLSTINFTGTKEEWQRISKNHDWQLGAYIETINCIDGEILLK